MSLQDIVNVVISRETKTVSRQGFGIPMVLGNHKGFTDRFKIYTKQADVLLDFSSTEPIALMTNAIFSQKSTVKSVYVGRRANADTTVVTITAVDKYTYTFKVNGKTASYTADIGDTNIVIAAALKVAIDALSEPITVTDNLDGSFDVDPTVPATAYAFTTLSAANVAIANTTTQTVALDLTDIYNLDSTWYAFAIDSKVQGDQESAASWAESNKRIFGTSSSDSDIVDTTDAADVTTLAAVLKAASYARTFLFYSATAATQYVECALLGVILPQVPGAYTAAFKTLASVTYDNLTPTQRTNALAKNVNIYELVGGINITNEGKVSEGEFIDIIILVDWLNANITSEVYSVLVNSSKVPYTDFGIAAVGGAIQTVLQLGQQNGGIALDDGEGGPGFVITLPAAADISSATKATRVLSGVEFTALLTGAIHAVEIQGFVTL